MLELSAAFGARLVGVVGSNVRCQGDGLAHGRSDQDGTRNCLGCLISSPHSADSSNFLVKEGSDMYRVS